MSNELRKEYDHIQSILSELYLMLDKAIADNVSEKGIDCITDAIKSVKEDEMNVVKKIRENIYKSYTKKEIDKYIASKKINKRKLIEEQERQQKEKNIKLFSDAKIVFDGSFNLIYNNDQGLITKRLDKQLLDKDDNNKYDYNIYSFLSKIDSEHGTSLCKMYMDGQLPVIYDFSSSNKLKWKDYKKLKKVADKGIESNDNIRIIPRKKTGLKVAIGMVALSATLALSAIGFNNRKKAKSESNVDTNTITVSNEIPSDETSFESKVISSVKPEPVKNSDLKKEVVKEYNNKIVNKTTSIEEVAKKCTINLKDGSKKEVEELNDEFNDLSIGSVVELPDMDLYYASTEEKPVGNTKNLSAPTGIYKISLISIVYKGRCLEVLSNETSLDTLKEYVKETYGDDVKIFVNFDVINEEGKTIYKNVGWVNSDILTQKKKVMIKK